MTDRSHQSLPFSSDRISRRSFVAGASAAAAAAGMSGGRAWAAPSSHSKAETIVGELYANLAPEQKKEICFEFNHPKRTQISANWPITKPSIGDDFYTPAQRDLIGRVLKNVSSEDGYQRLLKQMEDDTGEGINGYHIAFFGEPGGEGFQWELTGRHLTARADGNSVKNMAFGGPVIYGHGEEDAKNNLFHYQTRKANEVFASLNDDQQKMALLEKAPPENAVPLQAAGARFPGLSVGSLSSDQKALFSDVVKIILAPYRSEDVDEVHDILHKTGGLDKLHMAFYQQDDLDNDKVWDIWRVEGPGFVWHFRGAPHVHAYVHIGLLES